MEISVLKKDLLKIVTRMQGVAERKSSMPALSNVLLVVEEKTLRVSATDLYLSISGQIPAEIKKKGTIAIPAKDLLERVRMMPEGQIMITAQENAQTVLKSSASARRYTLRGMPGEEFPQLPQPGADATSMSIAIPVVQDLIAKTYFSISTDETRPNLNSALLEWEGEVVRMVSTDGHRLSKMEKAVDGKNANQTLLIPLKAVLELRRMCDEMMAEAPKDGKDAPLLQITRSGPNAFFHAGNTTFAVKLVDSSFPRYSDVIPKKSERSIRIPRAAFADALKAVSIAANERTGGVKLAIGAGTMRITSESPDSGDGFDEIPVDYNGAALTIGFNAKYFLDLLGSLHDEEVVLLLSGELDPAVVRPGNEKEFLGVVMPMSI